MLTLEEIMRRFTARQAIEPPTEAIEPVTPKPNRPVVVNGLQQLLTYLADQDKRITAIEQELKELRGSKVS